MSRYVGSSQVKSNGSAGIGSGAILPSSRGPPPDTEYVCYLSVRRDRVGVKELRIDFKASTRRDCRLTYLKNAKFDPAKYFIPPKCRLKRIWHVVMGDIVSRPTDFSCDNDFLV